MNELAQELRQFIDENFLFGIKTEYSDEDSFLEKSIVDSTGVLELIAHLEDTYGIIVDDEDLVPENLDSVNRLVRFIAARKAAGATTS